MQYKNIIIRVGLSLGAIILMIAAIIIPTTRNIYKLETRISEVRLSLELQYQNRIKARQTLRFLDAIRTRLQEFKKIMLTEGQEIDFITTLEGLADKFALEQRLTIQPPEAKQKNDAGGRSLTVNINLRGSADNVLRYVADIERLPRYFFVDQISVVQATDEQGEGLAPGTVTAVIHGKILWTK